MRTAESMIELTDNLISEWREKAAEQEGETGQKKSRATRRANKIYDKIWKLARKFPEVEQHLDRIGDGPIYL